MSTTDFKGTEQRHKAAQQLIDQIAEQVAQQLIKSAHDELIKGIKEAVR